MYKQCVGLCSDQEIMADSAMVTTPVPPGILPSTLDVIHKIAFFVARKGDHIEVLCLFLFSMVNMTVLMDHDRVRINLIIMLTT